MSLKQLVLMAILGSTSVAFEDADAGADKERMWTIHAARMYETKGKADKPEVSSPGVWVTAQRDPHGKRDATAASPAQTATATTTTAQQ